VIREHDLNEMGTNLEVTWTGETGERTSLRDLISGFNEATNGTARREAGVPSLSVDASSTYEARRSESGSEVTRAGAGSNEKESTSTS